VTRAAIQCLGGIVANDPAEAVYLNTFTDVADKKLSGANRYVLHFGKEEFPKVEAFWSMTMYDLTYNLVANPINRYSIGNRTKGLKFDPDGGLTMFIQNDSPGKDKESNWLPAPKGEFYLILRAYMPGEAIVAQTWRPPAVTPVPK
jgi:hypothetical protein